MIDFPTNINYSDVFKYIGSLSTEFSVLVLVLLVIVIIGLYTDSESKRLSNKFCTNVFEWGLIIYFILAGFFSFKIVVSCIIGLDVLLLSILNIKQTFIAHILSIICVVCLFVIAMKLLRIIFFKQDKNEGNL